MPDAHDAGTETTWIACIMCNGTKNYILMHGERNPCPLCNGLGGWMRKVAKNGIQEKGRG